MCVKRTFFQSGKPFFLSRTSANNISRTIQTQNKERSNFNFQLTPRKNRYYDDSVKWTFFFVWKASVSIQNIRKQSWSILIKSKERSNFIFQFKPWVNPFEKSLVWYLCKMDIFQSGKPFFPSRTPANNISWSILTKNKERSNFHFSM